MHQKYRVYEFSTSETQRDDIEFAIASYVDGMNKALYLELAKDRKEFLLNHVSFAKDMEEAIKALEAKL
ncbi:hypothetical protein HMPREF9296_1466 [Prevotella disiens FB035-09AN]|uniref:Uncharacterized protein n=1 Tax=Prevotella disiens FB035-09AN TaxID=866771 RepID=E1KS06_9BACT|nr:hypothetical protein HMPREF9296_1466 [Prevotella disiens FB035-09AN]